MDAYFDSDIGVVSVAHVHERKTRQLTALRGQFGGSLQVPGPALCQVSIYPCLVFLKYVEGFARATGWRLAQPFPCLTLPCFKALSVVTVQRNGQ